MTNYVAKSVIAYQQQFARVAVIPFTFQTAINAGATFIPGLQLPPGAIPFGAPSLSVTTAFDSTTATVSVGTVGSPAANLAATSVKAVAVTALTVAAATTTQNLGLTFAVTGTPTVGAGVVYIPYIQPYGADFNVGNNQQPTL
jgi:hypothetical protein